MSLKLTFYVIECDTSVKPVKSKLVRAAMQSHLSAWADTVESQAVNILFELQFTSVAPNLLVPNVILISLPNSSNHL